MDDDRNLSNEFDRQFELRTGLVKRDKSKFWDTKEGLNEWEEIASQKRKRPNVLLVAAGSAGILLFAAIVWKIAVTSSQPALSEKQPGSGEPVRIQSAEEVARAFLEQTDPHSRLDWVRDREVVATHFPLYAEEALSHVPEHTELRGHHMENGLARTAFAVRFESGNFRLLNVVETHEGLRVDWDSYARYCSSSWDDLLSGRSTSAEVRVFVSPGDYHNVPFSDPQSWTCFRFMSPDLPEREDVFAYARIGTLREQEMKAAILNAPDFRQHMTLVIDSQEAAGGKRMFEITLVLAVGWVRGDEDIESVWEKR
ncbi:MAG: hypothetical protein KDN22_06875 [Verrucomicrobiae bacterium]|nr:hypothetical protein [Verrucomicrobiae bacterium]